MGGGIIELFPNVNVSDCKSPLLLRCCGHNPHDLPESIRGDERIMAELRRSQRTWITLQ